MWDLQTIREKNAKTTDSVRKVRDAHLFYLREQIVSCACVASHPDRSETERHAALARHHILLAQLLSLAAR